jgi:peroxiredoxin
MASTKHKKRGSTLTLVILLVVLVVVTAYLLISSDVVTKAEASEGSVAALVEQSPEDLAKTTLINAGDMAPDFTVKMLDGSEVTLSKLQGKPTLLIFWATWCPPCRVELSKLQEHIIDRYGESINVLPISRGEERAKVDEFITKMGYTFAVGLDGDQSIYQKYATNYIPRCFVIDAKGKVLYSGVGYDEKVAAEVEESIDKALRK